MDNGFYRRPNVTQYSPGHSGWNNFNNNNNKVTGNQWNRFKQTGIIAGNFKNPYQNNGTQYGWGGTGTAQAARPGVQQSAWNFNNNRTQQNWGGGAAVNNFGNNRNQTAWGKNMPNHRNQNQTGSWNGYQNPAYPSINRPHNSTSGWNSPINQQPYPYQPNNPRNTSGWSGNPTSNRPNNTYNSAWNLPNNPNSSYQPNNHNATGWNGNPSVNRPQNNTFNAAWNLPNNPNSSYEPQKPAQGSSVPLAPIGSGPWQAAPIPSNTPQGGTGTPLAPIFGAGTNQWNAGGQANLSYGFNNPNSNNNKPVGGSSNPYSNLFH